MYKSSDESKLESSNDMDGLDIVVSNYYKEYYYTENHVSIFKNGDKCGTEDYNFTIYRQKNCLIDLNLSFAVIDFSSCYDKVQEALGLNQSLIILLKRQLNKTTGAKYSNFYFYDPRNGERLNLSNLCEDVKMEVQDSIYDLLERVNADSEIFTFLLKQNIDIFDKDGAFYTDICFEFEIPGDKDIALEDRLKVFFSNISLCTEGCTSKGINITTMKAICSCDFNDIVGSGSVISGVLDDYLGVIKMLNFPVLKCMKYMFKGFQDSAGGYIMIFCIVIVSFMALIFYLKDIEKIKKYIINKTTSYINYLNETIPYEEEKKQMQ